MENTEKQEPKRYVLGAAVAIFRSDRVLALRRAEWKRGAGLWEVVAGRVEEGESLEAAAIREAKEETGLDVTIDPRPLGAYPVQSVSDAYFIVLFRGDAPEGDVRRSDEHDEHRWVSPAEFCELSTLTNLSRAIARFGASTEEGPT